MYETCIVIRAEHQTIFDIIIYVLKRYKGVEKLSALISGCCSCIKSVSLINNSRWLKACACGWLSWVCVWRLLRHSIVCSCVTKPYGFELLTLPSVALFSDWRWIKNNRKRLEIKHVWFFEGFFSVDETVKSIPVLCSKKVWNSMCFCVAYAWGLRPRSDRARCLIRFVINLC